MSAKLKTTKHNVIVKALSDVLIDTFEPLISALDSHLALPEDVLATGQERPSQRDQGLRIMLSMLINTVHRQTYGEITSSNTGNKIQNVNDRYKDSEQRLHQITQRYHGDEDKMFEDPYFIRAAGYLDINEKRLEAYDSVIRALCDTYRTIFNEDWKPMEANSTSTGKVDEATKERLKAMMAKRKAIGAAE